jgi:hypothetical protein
LPPILLPVVALRNRDYFTLYYTGYVTHTRVYPNVSGLSHNKIYTYNNKHSLEATQIVMAAKLTGLAHKITIQLHLVTESCTICNSGSRWPVRKLLDTASYTDINIYCFFVREYILSENTFLYVASRTSVRGDLETPVLSM